MSTRGFIGFVINGCEKLTYNHHDSYPSGLGLDVLTWAVGVTDWDKVREQAAAIMIVDEQEKPTEDERIKFAEFSDTGVSTGDDWYAILRNLHGNLQGYLDAGIMTDGSGFPLDSLFAEWGYLVNLDDSTFEVYRGFQMSVPGAGRWAGRPTAEENAAEYAAHVAWCAEQEPPREPWFPTEPKYKAVNLCGVWPLHKLPDALEFAEVTNNAKRD